MAEYKEPDSCPVFIRVYEGSDRVELTCGSHRNSGESLSMDELDTLIGCLSDARAIAILNTMVGA